MNDNIKILWNLIEEGFEKMCPLEAQAIENLITNYQEQEVFIGKLLKENEELRKNSVPVAKIKEKIEELDGKSGGNTYHVQSILNAQKRILQELLEGK